MYKYFNNNPLARRTVGDCAVRAVSKALDVSWDEAHDMLADMSKSMGTIMNEKTIENFKKLPPEKQIELIVLLEKLLSCYLQGFFAHSSTVCID